MPMEGLGALDGLGGLGNLIGGGEDKKEGGISKGLMNTIGGLCQSAQFPSSEGALTEMLPVPRYLTAMLCSEAKYSTELTMSENRLYTKCLHHNCQMTYLSGQTYQGEMEFGLLHGQGKLNFPDGASYEGQFRHDSMQGQGEMNLPNGVKYTGSFRVNQRHGEGVMEVPSKEWKYRGEWSQGKMEGKARIEYSNGSVYEGQVQNGLKNGFGRITYASGNYYEGNWVANLKEGQGKMYWLDRNEIYDGEWAKNKCEGWGTHYYLNQNRKDQILTNRYQGQFKDGQRHGYGTYYYADGSKYEGEWKFNQKDGFADFVKENGSVSGCVYERERMIEQLSSFNDETDNLLFDEEFLKNHIEDATAQEPINTSLLNHQKKPSLMPIQEITESHVENKSKDLSEKIDMEKKIGKPTSVLGGQMGTSFISINAPSTVSAAYHVQGTSALSRKPTLQGDVSIVSESTTSNKRQKKLPGRILARPSLPVNLQANPYMFLINLDDILESHEDLPILRVTILETLLRCHSKVKEIYTFFKNRYTEPKFDLYGNVMRLEGFWKFVRETRLENSRTSIPELNRLIFRGKKNSYLLETSPEAIEARVNLLKREKEEKDRRLDLSDQDQEASLNKGKKDSSFEEDSFSGEDPDKKIADLAQQTVDDLHRNSISAEIDLVEFMPDPSEKPEVDSELAKSTISLCLNIFYEIMTLTTEPLPFSCVNLWTVSSGHS